MDDTMMGTLCFRTIAQAISPNRSALKCPCIGHISLEHERLN